MAEWLTPAVIRADVAEMLHRNPDEGFDLENLFECGLDSIRLLTLLERWRAAGVQVSFVELAERPTLAEWLALLASRLPVAVDA
jgi:bifunctional isochorismate lyase/aryl carrier protein